MKETLISNHKTAVERKNIQEKGENKKEKEKERCKNDRTLY